MNQWATALRLVLKDLTPGDAHVPTPNWPRKQRRKLARVLLKLAGDEGLYIGRQLTPECDARLRAWAAAQGLPTLDPHLHVTVAHSRVSFPWELAAGTVAVPRNAFLQWQLLGAEGAVVLRFRSPSLHSRWTLSRKQGAQWEYASYSPHLTLYYHGPVPRTLPDFPLEFGPEEMGPCGGNVFKGFDESQHPRGDHGRFGLSSVQEQWVRWYHAHGSKQINAALRGEKSQSKNVAEAIRHLDTSFAPLPEALTVYRGVPVNGARWEYGQTLAAAKPGSTYTHHGYTSTSTDEGTALAYGPVVLVSKLPQGTPALKLNEALNSPDHRDESEVLLPRGTSFTVRKVVRQGPRTYLHVDYHTTTVVKAFDATDHPRDEKGQFVHGATVEGPLPKGSKRPVVWLGETGQPLPPEAQAHLTQIAGKGFNAPNYTNQRYFAPDPARKATYVGEVTDAKGRSKRFYLDDNEQAKYAVKTARVRAFANGYEAYTQKLDAASATGSHDALSLRLLTKTGMRPGSDRDTGADTKAYGATNMPTAAATVTGDTVHFRFPAKNGKTYVTSVEDALLARHVELRQQAGADRLFDTNETKVRGLFKQLTGNGQLQLKDIRTAHGTAIAQRELMQYAFKPASDREFAALQRTIATKVAAALQNTPKVALEKYILDGVWHGYRPHGTLLKVGQHA
jgi:DNA topoisomerase IB